MLSLTTVKSTRLTALTLSDAMPRLKTRKTQPLLLHDPNSLGDRLRLEIATVPKAMRTRTKIALVDRL